MLKSEKADFANQAAFFFKSFSILFLPNTYFALGCRGLSGKLTLPGDLCCGD